MKRSNMDTILCHRLSPNFHNTDRANLSGSILKKRSRRGKRMGKRHTTAAKKIIDLIPDAIISRDRVTTASCSFCACQIVIGDHQQGQNLCQRCERLFPDQANP